MAYLQGYYDDADDHSGYRIVYLTAHEMIGDIARMLMWFGLMAVSLRASAYVVCVVDFIYAAITSSVIKTQRFAALK